MHRKSSNERESARGRDIDSDRDLAGARERRLNYGPDRIATLGEELRREREKCNGDGKEGKRIRGAAG